MPGWISSSGLAVSTVVDTIAMNQSLAATFKHQMQGKKPLFMVLPVLNI
jgi:hypothetical protein